MSTASAFHHCFAELACGRCGACNKGTFYKVGRECRACSAPAVASTLSVGLPIVFGAGARAAGNVNCAPYNVNVNGTTCAAPLHAALRCAALRRTQQHCMRPCDAFGSRGLIAARSAPVAGRRTGGAPSHLSDII